MSKWKRQRRTISISKDQAPDSWDCVDCGVNTAPGCHTRATLEKAINEEGRATVLIDNQSEVYTVHHHVWKAAGMEPFSGCLCIGCLELRLGRRLMPDDFPPERGFNRTDRGTERLRSRWERRA